MASFSMVSGAGVDDATATGDAPASLEGADPAGTQRSIAIGGIADNGSAGSTVDGRSVPLREQPPNAVATHAAATTIAAVRLFAARPATRLGSSAGMRRSPKVNRPENHQPHFEMNTTGNSLALGSHTAAGVSPDQDAVYSADRSAYIKLPAFSFAMSASLLDMGIAGQPHERPCLAFPSTT